MEKQLHVFYSGHVQGIGFRYTVTEIARKMKICGWVKNLDDRRVEIVAQAQEELLEGFLEQIQQSFSRHIRNVDTEWLPAAGEFRDFSVRF